MSVEVRILEGEHIADTRNYLTVAEAALDASPPAPPLTGKTGEPSFVCNQRLRVSAESTGGHSVKP